MTASITSLNATKLERLAERIKTDLARREQSKAEWVKATIDLCEALAEARAEFKDDQSFGNWFRASGFELNHQDRAAAIAMGQSIEQARPVLEVTERRSLRHIYANECRFTHVGKPPRRKAEKPAEPKLFRPGPKTQEVLDAIDRHSAAGVEPSEDTIKAETGASASTVNKAFNIRKAAAAAAGQPLPDFGLSATAQQKLEAAIRAHTQRLEREFDDRVRQASTQWLNDVRIPIYEKKLAEIEHMLSWPRFSVMTKAEYNAIVMCLHPDSLKARTEEQLAEAFRIFTRYKLKLINDDEERDEERRRALSSLPRTLEELLARKKTGQRQ